MKIGELAQKTGLAASAIRFYEKQGLIHSPGRSANGYRHYDDNTMRRLHIVRSVQKLGFSLDVIRGLFMHDGRCSKARTVEQIDIRLEEVRQLEANLLAQRAELLSLRELLEDSIKNGLDPTCSASFTS